MDWIVLKANPDTERQHLNRILQEIAAFAGGGSAVWGAITGTLSDQTDLQAELDGKEDVGVAATLDAAHVAAGDPHPQYLTAAEGNAAYQPLDSDLTAIAALAPTDDDIIQRKSGAWTNRTMAQLKIDLNLSGTNTGDQDLSTYALTTYVDGKVIDSIADSDTTHAPSRNAVYDYGLAISNAANSYADALIVDSIADSDTTHAPSRNAVYDALALKQDLIPWIDAGGTADALTANFTPDFIHGDGRVFRVRAALANTTTTPTLNIDGAGANLIVKKGNQALAAGDIAGLNHELWFVVRDDFITIRYELINPATDATGGGSGINIGLVSQVPNLLLFR